MTLSRKKIDAIFSILAAANPHPKTELYYTNDFTLLVAIILSAQATDAGVNKATPELFKAAPTPDAMLALGEAGLKPYIKTIGLYPTKAKNIIAMSERLVQHYAGAIPETVEALETLAGVGRKTANVWMNCARGKPTIAVDTHVFRVSNRLGLCHTTTPLHTEQALLKVIPKRWLKDAHHWLILHGRYICIARKPKCEICSIRQYCEFFHDSLRFR